MAAPACLRSCTTRLQNDGRLGRIPGEKAFPVEDDLQEALQAFLVPIAERAGRSIFQVTAYQLASVDLFLPQDFSRFSIDEIQDGGVDAPPGIQQRSGKGRSMVERREIERGQQAEFPPTRVKTLAAARW